MLNATKYMERQTLCIFFLDQPVLNAVTAIFHYSLAGLFTWIFIAVSTALQFPLMCLIIGVYTCFYRVGNWHKEAFQES